MPLDLTALSQQVRQMRGALVHDAQDTSARLEQLLSRLLGEAEQPERWAEAVDLSRETCGYLLARPTEPLNTVVDAPPRPADYLVVATDGSQIEVDRHGIAAYYVINIGQVFLRYGSAPAARLSTEPVLYYRDEDLYLTDGARRVPIEGNYLSARRDMEEGLALARLAGTHVQAGLPAVAVQDGTLVRWTLSGAERFVQEAFLEPYLGYLSEMRRLGVATASYISRPRSPEVVGMVRLMHCPDVQLEQHRGANCRECSDMRAGRVPSCEICRGLTDADLLADTLAEGQRGPLYASMSRINVERYGEHLIHFFSMRVGHELARVEIPRWVAENPEQVNLVHAVLYDQAIKGQGYPVALARAHEQAVVRAADKRAFQGLVQSSMLQADVPARVSGKALSKGRRAM